MTAVRESEAVLDAPGPVHPPLGEGRLALQRVAVLVASVLLGVATALPAFSASFSRSDPLSVRHSALTSTFWHASALWVLCPVALVILALLGVWLALFSDRAQVNHRGLFIGLGALVPIVIECAKVSVFASSTAAGGHLRYLPAVGTYLSFLAAVFLIVWPGLWSQAQLRRERHRLGGAVTGDGGWFDPTQVWSEAKPSWGPLTAGDPAARPEGQGSQPAGWYPDPAHADWLAWWDGERWTHYRAMPNAHSN
jgi:hypothetical protein